MRSPKEIPILACDSVAANLFEGWQTQHRVPMKPQPKPFGDRAWSFRDEIWAGDREFLNRYWQPFAPWQPGDRLYVRECWGLWDTQPEVGPERAQLLYRAEDGGKHFARYQLWRPSIHMPKWAARTWLEVARVWAERIQEISEADAKAEGVDRHFHTDEGIGQITLPRSTYRRGFAALWESLYPGSWARNDWVWACEFRKIEAPVASRATAAAATT